MASPLDAFMGGMQLPPLSFASPNESRSGDIFSTPVFNSSGWNVNFRGTQIASASGGGADAGGPAMSLLPAAVYAGIAYLIWRAVR